MTVRVVAAPCEEPDLILDEIEDDDELVNELRSLLDEGRDLALDFRVAPGPKVSPLDAAARLRGLLEAREAPPSVTVHCRSERAAEAIRRLLEHVDVAGSVFEVGRISIEVAQVDIVDVHADAVVNASNTALVLGAGVSGALKRAAGPELQRAMSALAPIDPRTIVETGSFRHTKVGKIFHVPTVRGTEEVVRCGYRNVLRLAARQGLRRVALPSLGTGSGKMGARTGAALFLEEVRAFAATDPEYEMSLILALLDGHVAATFAEVLTAHEA